MRWFTRWFEPDAQLVERLRVVLARGKAELPLPDEARWSAWLGSVAAQLDCSVDDVEFLCSAIDSYRFRQRGVSKNVTYDRAHREVFRALEQLERLQRA